MEQLGDQRHELVGRDLQRHDAAERRADRRSADDVDLDPELVQRTPHAEMGEAASATAAEHEAGGVARHEPGEPAHVVGRSLAKVGDPIEPEAVGDLGTPVWAFDIAAMDEPRPIARP